MPYMVEKNEDGQFCVFLAGADGQAEGETLGCHETADEAGEQIAAIEAEEESGRDAPEPERATPEPQARMIPAYMERKAASDEPGTPLRFIASTEEIARDGGIVTADGWQLDNYRRNPVFLWAHDYTSLPLGRAEVQVRDGKLMAEVVFDQADDFARQVEGKYRRGFLNAVSVGWQTLEFADGRALPPGAMWMSLKHELQDVSAVPVPADPLALAERQRSLMHEWARSIIQSDDSQPAPASGEPAWPEVAAAMVALFRSDGDDPDEARLAAYNALLPRYRRLGKTAPEFLDAATLSALGPAERRGLFLAGEPELLPDEFAEPEPEQPAGPSVDAVLVQIQARLAATESDTRQLKGLLSRLIANQPEPPATQGAAGGDDGNGRQRQQTQAQPKRDDTILRSILERLEQQ